MSMLAIVLAMTLAPPHTPPSVAPPPVVQPRLPAPCPDIDPGLVHDVAPPEGRGPLWPVGRLDPRYLDFGPALKAGGPQALAPMACPRLQPITAR